MQSSGWRQLFLGLVSWAWRETQSAWNFQTGPQRCLRILVYSDMHNKELTGTWKLLSASSTTSGGERNEAPYGVSPSGFLTYTSDGRVTALISYGGRKLLQARAAVEEQAEAFKTFLAYAGRYTLSGDQITHHVEISSIQNYVNKDLVRTVRFEGDRIKLLTPPTPVNGKIQTVELIWQRLPSDS